MKSLLWAFIILMGIPVVTRAQGVCCDVKGMVCGNKGVDDVYCACYCDVHSDDEDCMVSSTTEVSSTSGDGETTTPGCDVGQVADDSGTNCRMSIDLRSAFGKTWNIRMG